MRTTSGGDRESASTVNKILQSWQIAEATALLTLVDQKRTCYYTFTVSADLKKTKMMKDIFFSGKEKANL